MGYDVYYPTKHTTKSVINKDHVLCKTNMGDCIFSVIPGQVVSVGGSFRTSDIAQNRYIVDNSPDALNDLTGDLSKIDNFSTDRNMFLRNYIVIQHYDTAKKNFIYSVYMNMLTIEVLPGDWIEAGQYLGTSGILKDRRDSGGKYLDSLLALGHINNNELGYAHIFFVDEKKYIPPKQIFDKSYMENIAKYDDMADWKEVLEKRKEEMMAWLQSRMPKNEAEASEMDAVSGGGNSGQVSTIIEAAREQLGVPYVWGGESLAEGGFDCSGLMQHAFKVGGINLPRTAALQQDFCTKISMDELRPGDLIFKSDPASHVVLYIGEGDNEIIHAPQTGDVVKYAKIYSGLNLAGRVPGLDFSSGSSGGGVISGSYSKYYSGLTGKAKSDIEAYNGGGGPASKAEATMKSIESQGWKQTLIDVCKQEGIDSYLVFGILANESTGDKNQKTTGNNDVGAMQVHNGRKEIRGNIIDGINHLKKKIKYLKGKFNAENPLLSAQSYNSGEGSVQWVIEGCNLQSKYATLTGNELSENWRKYYKSGFQAQSHRHIYGITVLMMADYARQKKFLG